MRHAGERRECYVGIALAVRYSSGRDRPPDVDAGTRPIRDQLDGRHSCRAWQLHELEVAGLESEQPDGCHSRHARPTAAAAVSPAQFQLPGRRIASRTRPMLEPD